MDLPLIDPELKQDLEDNNLVYITDKTPGYFRQGKSFYDLNGKKVTDEKILERINDLVIPPAWKDVWVSPKRNSHLQATGIDEKGRKQYLYHSKWKELCQENKFSKMVDFGLALPKIRGKVDYQLQSDKIDKQKILATIIWLLENTFIRIGNEEYAQDNNSYGLTTLRNKHIRFKGKTVILNFIGKSGVPHLIEISKPSIVKTIKQCIELPGYELFQFIDQNGDKHVVDSSDVNLFLKDITKDDFSAKDFRTWGASTISANTLHQIGPAENLKLTEKNVKETVKKVASHLRNTVSVCRNYYIHPTVIETYQKNILIPHFDKYSKQKSKTKGLDWDEYALIKLLQDHPI